MSQVVLISLTTLEALSHAPCVYGAYMHIPKESGERWAGYGHQTRYLWVKNNSGAECQVEQSTQGAWFGPRTLWLRAQTPAKRDVVNKRLCLCSAHESLSLHHKQSTKRTQT